MAVTLTYAKYLSGIKLNLTNFPKNDNLWNFAFSILFVVFS